MITKVGLWQEGDLSGYLGTGRKRGDDQVKYTGDYNADGTPTRQVGPDDRQM